VPLVTGDDLVSVALRRDGAPIVSGQIKQPFPARAALEYPVGCQNSATILDQGFYAARWY